MKTKSKIRAYIIRSGAWAVFLLVAFIALSSAFDLPNRSHKPSTATDAYDVAAKVVSQPSAFSFAERVAFQRSIEEVYWRHRIWPKENPDPKPSLDAVMSQTQLENKVENYLRESLVLEDYWQKPITAEQLQAEIERMARDTKQPEVLRELFEALGNDPAVIAECLARPILAEHLIADFSAQGQTRNVESPQTDALPTMSAVATLGQVIYTLPKIADTVDPPCTDNTWTATSTTNVPSARSGHTAVWTGTEMIVWGGTDALGGGVNAPLPPPPHVFNTGGRYNPSTDSWTATSTTNVPSARSAHTAVWTGSEMIVWGGVDANFPRNYFDTGGRYNPSTNSWVATNTINAPTARSGHTSVWTGGEMIVWGGSDGANVLNTGGRYNPSTNGWVATNTINAPTARSGHTSVWTGSEMIVWGGNGNTGGRYNPSTNSWVATNTINAPTGRSFHTAVWTGSEMIVWGGLSGDNSGGRYTSSTDSWTATSTTNAPDGRWLHTAVWTGSEMIVWGGINDGFAPENTGGRYCAQSGPTPTPTSTPTPTASPTPTPTPTPCTGRCSPTPRPRPSPPPRP